MLRFFLITVSLALSCLVNAQTVDGYKAPPAALKKLDKAKAAWIRFDFKEAENLSDKLVEQYPDWTESWMMYGQVYGDAGDQVKKEKALLRVVELDSISYPITFRWLAELRYSRGDYAAAASCYDKYIRLTRDTAGIPFRAKLLNASIRFALQQVGNARAGMPKKLGGSVNTTDDEYFPSLSVDGSTLVFTRQARGGAIPGQIRQEELFFSSFKDSGYTVPEAFQDPINTGRNEGTQSLSQDGRIMFFTSCNRPDTKGGCDLYYCVKTGEKWSDPINLGNPVNTGHWESTPFLAPDSKHLYFSSNRPGGYGGMDIWKSTLKVDHSWSEPVNMGSAINSPLDEMSPILLVDGKTFFFASNGHIGMGGFDLYKCDLTSVSKSSSVENLGYGINTFFDEDALTINLDSFTVLFTSNSDSVTGKDIYQAKMSRHGTLSSVFSLSGIVIDRITRIPVGAQIEVQPHGDTLLSRVEADPVTGKYLLGIPKRHAYRIGAAAKGYLPYSGYYVSDSAGVVTRIFHSIELEPIKAGASIVLRNTFFALNSFEILPESSRDMDEALTVFSMNPGIIIEISGHTDNSGSDDYNLKLSRNRAESVVKYLISRGINPLQLLSKGYGSTQPVASNETEEGRRLNRRTEMKVVSLK